MKLSTNLQTYKKRLLATISSKAPSLPPDASPETRDHISQMIQRFRGAMTFMSKTTINQDGKTLPLKELPWYILIGPENAGKTAMLAHAQVPYVLQKNFSPAAPECFEPSENCDWWITRHAGIIDVPSQYLFDRDSQQSVWKYFLSLMKKQGGNKNIAGIVIALPLPELMRQPDTNNLHDIMHTISKRIHDIQMTLEKPLPCYLVITKCDLLAGFREFFSESPDDEVEQAWGIILPQPKKSEQVEKIFEIHFNELIRKLNQQLLSRMHQERNPIVRPYIKNFPLQVERLKAYIAETIEQMCNSQNRCILHGIYLTSALQSRSEPQAVNFGNAITPDQNAMQIFKEPTATSRPYFIKQFISHGLQAPEQPIAVTVTVKDKRIRYAVYAASASAIVVTGFLLGHDFKIGFDQTHQIQQKLADYQTTLQQFHNPNESMMKTLQLLDGLQKSKIEDEKKGFIKKLSTYYSDKSQKNASIVYDNALQSFLIPEISNYFQDYLRNPINQDAESIYSVLKAYLMLGDMTHFDSNYIRTILAGILPKQFNQTNQLLHHFDVALENYQPVQLDQVTIEKTRKYLLSLRGSQLGYIILKTLDNNTQASDALLGDNVKTNALFTSKNSRLQIPAMFTGKNFVNVFEQQIPIAANEVATGNWILGTDFRLSSNPNFAAELAEELRTDYIKQYADTWETVLANVQIEAPRDLEQADAIITSMTSYDSPLLRILNNIHENTFFEPVTTASPKLFAIGQMIDRNNTTKTELYQILSHLEALHEYLHPILTSEDPKKAAYQLITQRMQHQGEVDPITKLRLAADQSPMPVKGWINQITNDAWKFLLRDSMRYLDTSWSEKVTKGFQDQLAHRYPFNSDAIDEVSYQKFIHFFGKPGVITSFFNNYLTPFVDTTKPEWSWKKLNGQDLPLSNEGLRQIQQAMQIHHAFFPKDDDQLAVPFALQQKKLAKNIESIMLNMNSKVIVDKHNNSHSPYLLTWPYNYDAKFSSIAMTLSGNKQVQVNFPGSWGWFKLVDQTFESARTDNQIVLNFSNEKAPAQYLLSTPSKNNPFLAFNLKQFNLPDQLSIMQA